MGRKKIASSVPVADAGGKSEKGVHESKSETKKDTESAGG